ncbi:PHP domain-like protein [Cylindrobasidium torrendii FP15055 ss-10]|uniref:PHP domain-like protein n=1 Tax=Cylindrobasidium torrendii FP15055 ss-10 TaxID=1314674 RepID=A0A0D7AYB5_9AGAR|nr:PHP domain-like protein [Cylindrobasidium torrendii FP15055 ss-10]
MFDLNVPIPNAWLGLDNPQKKSKGKQPSGVDLPKYTASQLASIEARVDLLVHLGYTAIAFNQTILSKIDVKTHVNSLDILLKQLKPRTDILYMKRLTIILDDESEKGFGLINANTSLFSAYDLLSLLPTTQATISLACLTHTLPSPLTAHIISIPLTLSRLPYNIKHTLVRTALKNGAVFELTYVGAVGGENDPALVDAHAAENGPSAKRNWWGAAREVARVTKGKGIIVSSGANANLDLRAPDDVKNLITLLDVPQDIAHASMSKFPKSLVLRAQTRKTYRAVFSEPRLVIPEGSALGQEPTSTESPASQSASNAKKRPAEIDIERPEDLTSTSDQPKKKKQKGRQKGNEA